MYGGWLSNKRVSTNRSIPSRGGFQAQDFHASLSISSKSKEVEKGHDRQICIKGHSGGAGGCCSGAGPILHFWHMPLLQSPSSWPPLDLRTLF